MLCKLCYVIHVIDAAEVDVFFGVSGFSASFVNLPDFLKQTKTHTINCRVSKEATFHLCTFWAHCYQPFRSIEFFFVYSWE